MKISPLLFSNRERTNMELILLTGFLGSGKTTLLQQLLREYEDKKIGVIVNDFGKINVDAKLVSSSGIQMAELANGSIFCACIKDKFVDSLIEMSQRDLDYLFIEASGLADPSNMPVSYHISGQQCQQGRRPLSGDKGNR